MAYYKFLVRIEYYQYETFQLVFLTLQTLGAFGGVFTIILTSRLIFNASVGYITINYSNIFKHLNISVRNCTTLNVS